MLDQVKEVGEVLSALRQYKGIQRFIYSYLTIVLCVFFSVASIVRVDFTSAQTPTVSASQLLSQTNHHRSIHGAGQLSHAENLSVVAQLRAEHMRDNGYFAHQYDGITNLAKHTAQSNGYSSDTWYIGENLYAHSNIVYETGINADIVSAWMNSPDHRANVLHGAYRVVGHGWAYAEKAGQVGTIVVAIYADKDIIDLTPNEPTQSEDEEIVEEVKDPTPPPSEPEEQAVQEVESEPTPPEQPKQEQPAVVEEISTSVEEPSYEASPAPPKTVIVNDASTTESENIEQNFSGPTEVYAADNTEDTVEIALQDRTEQIVSIDDRSNDRDTTTPTAETTSSSTDLAVLSTASELPSTGPSGVLSFIPITMILGYVTSLFWRIKYPSL